MTGLSSGQALNSGCVTRPDYDVGDRRIVGNVPMLAALSAEQAQGPRLSMMDAASRPVQLYGDESTYQEIFAYGLLAVPTVRQPAIVDSVARIKTSFGVAPTAAIHCRELFVGDARAKGPWKELQRDDVFRLLQQISEC